eukprot:m.1752 g.1752  ORF g.1752 m.1752 type:complete len:88 (-) comp1979_c0_seq1:211-474(-)
MNKYDRLCNPREHHVRAFPINLSVVVACIKKVVLFLEISEANCGLVAVHKCEVKVVGSCELPDPRLSKKEATFICNVYLVTFDVGLQ